jgi:hypothetical protein
MWLVSFGQKLDCIKDIPQFDKLLERLRDPDQFIGAEAEADTIYKLLLSGFIIELYPKVGNRKADLKASANNFDYNFEITSLQPSMKAIFASRTSNSLTLPYIFMYPNEIIVQCQIHKILAEPRINELKRQIEQVIEQVRENKKQNMLI